MYIGRAAELSGTTVKTIRHYEQLGLLPPPRRQGKYRIYDQAGIDTLRFIKCAQQLGFRLKELREILGDTPAPDFPWELAQQAIARKKQQLASRIAELQTLHRGLEEFEHGIADARAECPLHAGQPLGD
ncbi:MerR family transcriptional regulator [Pseudomonas oryzae]|uniref:Transcriptional regulator, MerR family n=1 Tax=Pseudomonas oryzae TaxID=1392877 RepID=A0A1H1QY49_9PSED|nr:MerR family transcriptional regulator [Pseudomonas oryzae]SDS28491.1 transcriptional regulator, MerR family [Pseudomonas oryzae]